MTAANEVLSAGRHSRRSRQKRGSSFVKARNLVIVALMLATTACGGRKELEDGGVYVRRTVCPQVAIPAATGDVTLFDPADRLDATSIDVVATMTNLRATCDEGAESIVSTASFDIVATRRDAAAARTVVLPYFDIAMQAGAQVVAKRVGRVAISFPAGSLRAVSSGQATIRVSRAATVLPENVRAELTKRRKAGDADAAIDPLSDPAVRAAVARATFEHLVGFQLTQAQLRYNATR